MTNNQSGETPLVEVKPTTVLKRDSNIWALIVSGAQPGEKRFVTESGELSKVCVGEEVLSVVASNIVDAGNRLRNMVLDNAKLKDMFKVNTSRYA